MAGISVTSCLPALEGLVPRSDHPFPAGGQVVENRPCRQPAPHTPAAGGLTRLLQAGPAEEMDTVFPLNSALHPSPPSQGSGP